MLNILKDKLHFNTLDKENKMNKNKVVLKYLQGRFERKTLRKSQQYVEISLYSAILMYK